MNDSRSPAQPVSDTGKYLTLSLAGEAYAFPVLKVREIIRVPKVTPVAQLPAHVRGVMNLRGTVIPVVDLRMKLGLAAAVGERTCVVVVQVLSPSGRTIPLGLVVDSVDEVAQIAADQIEPTPHLMGHAGAIHLVGIAKVRGEVKLLLDLDRLIEAGVSQMLQPAA